MICVLILTLIAAFTYYITISDGTYKEKDWSNTGYVVSEMALSKVNIENITTSENGWSLGIDLDKTVDEIIETLESKNGVLDKYISNKNLREYLKAFIKAELITQYPDLRSADKIGTQTQSNEFQGCIQIQRALPDSTNGERELLTYVDYNTFNLYISNGDSEATKHFTLDSNGNLIVAGWTRITTNVRSDDPGVKNIYNDIEYTLNTNSINYQVLVKSCSMPFDFLWALTVMSEDEEFAYNVAQLALNSKIIITVQDNLTTVINDKLEKYKIEEETISTDEFGNETTGTEYIDYYIRTIIKNEDCTTVLNMTYANTWIAEYINNYSNIPSEDVEANVTSNNVETDSGDIHTKENSTITRTITTSYNVYIQEATTVTKKTDKNSTTDNFVTLFIKYQKANKNILSSPEWLFEMLEGSSKTSDMIDIVKYLLYKATEKSYGVTELDLDIFDPSKFKYNSALAGDLIVKTDEVNAAPTVDKLTLQNGIKNWVSGKQQENALMVLDKLLECEEKYKLNAVFIYALLQQECSIGTANSSWVKENNWMSLTSLGHIKYESPQANIDKGCKNIAQGSYYFKMGRYSLYEIGEVYCADPPPPEWANGIKEKMLALYNACGITVNLEGNQEVIEIAKSKLGSPYVWGAKGPNSFDCSGFVYWCYQQMGISVPGSTAGYTPYKGTAKEISFEEAQPGDILLIFGNERASGIGHAAIYLGNDSYIHAPGTGKVVTIVDSGAKTKFKHVFRF